MKDSYSSRDLQTAKARGKAVRIAGNIYAIISSIGCLYPIIWLVLSSLKTQYEFDVDSFSLPAHPTINNYLHVLSASNLVHYIGNSVIVSVCSVLGIVLFSFIIGYFLSRFAFRGKQVIFNIFLLGMIIPIHSLMVPTYIMFSRLGINDSLFGLMLPYICFELPIGIYLVESYVHSIPREMEAAASIDGASFSRTLFNIILPMTKPILVTVVIITFFYCWNEFSFALILINSEAKRTVPLGLTLFSGSFTTDYPVMMSAMVIATVPTLLLYVLFSRQIMDGMVAGAVKG